MRVACAAVLYSMWLALIAISAWSHGYLSEQGGSWDPLDTVVTRNFIIANYGASQGSTISYT